MIYLNYLNLNTNNYVHGVKCYTRDSILKIFKRIFFWFNFVIYNEKNFY